MEFNRIYLHLVVESGCNIVSFQHFTPKLKQTTYFWEYNTEDIPCFLWFNQLSIASV